MNPHGTGRMEIPAMLGRYAHLSRPHLWKAVKGLTQVGTVTKTVTDETTLGEGSQKLLKLGSAAWDSNPGPSP